MSTHVSPFHVTLAIESGDRRVPATLTFHNASAKVAPLCKLNACEDGRVQKDMFVITCGDREVDYIGPYFRRDNELHHEFVEVPPGEAFTVRVFLAETYDFPAGPAEYSAYYEAFDPAAPLDDVWELRSAPVRFELPAE